METIAGLQFITMNVVDPEWTRYWGPRAFAVNSNENILLNLVYYNGLYPYTLLPSIISPFLKDLTTIIPSSHLGNTISPSQLRKPGSQVMVMNPHPINDQTDKSIAIAFDIDTKTNTFKTMKNMHVMGSALDYMYTNIQPVGAFHYQLK